MKLKLKLILTAGSLLLVIAGSAWAAAGPVTITGVVTDSMCTVNGVDSKHKDCFKSCIQNGAKVVIVTPDQKVWTVENPESLKGKETKTVTVTGSGDEQTMTLKVDKVEKQ